MDGEGPSAPSLHQQVRSSARPTPLRAWAAQRARAAAATGEPTCPAAAQLRSGSSAPVRGWKAQAALLTWVPAGREAHAAPPPPPLALLPRSVRGGSAVGARRAGTRTLTFVPLHGDLGVRSRPLGSGAALSGLGSAPRAPRWPRPVRSRSPPDLPARLPRPGRSDPGPGRRAAPLGQLRRRPGRTFSAQVPAQPGRLPAWQRLRVQAPGAAGGNETGMCPNSGGGPGEGQAWAGLRELFFQLQGYQSTHCPEEETEAWAGGRDVRRAPPA